MEKSMEIGGIGDYQGTGRERDGEDLFNGYEVLFSGDESVLQPERGSDWTTLWMSGMSLKHSL